MPRPAASSQSLRAAGPPKQQIDRERGHDEQQRKLGRHHVGDSGVDRRQLGLGGKELEDPDRRQDDAHVHRGARGGGIPEPAGAAEGHEKDGERAGRHLVEERLVHVVRPAGVLRDHRRHHDHQQSAGEGERAGEPPNLSSGRGPVLSGEHHEHATEDDGDHPEGEDHVGRAHDLHVEPVGVVPPVVEGGRRDHDERAPDGDPGAQRSAESPEPHRLGALRARSRRRWCAAPASRSSRRRRWRRAVPGGAGGSRTCRGRRSCARRCPRGCRPRWRQMMPGRT